MPFPKNEKEKMVRSNRTAVATASSSSPSTTNKPQEDRRPTPPSSPAAAAAAAAAVSADVSTNSMPSMERKPSRVSFSTAESRRRSTGADNSGVFSSGGNTPLGQAALGADASGGSPAALDRAQSMISAPDSDFSDEESAAVSELTDEDGAHSAVGSFGGSSSGGGTASNITRTMNSGNVCGISTTLAVVGSTVVLVLIIIIYTAIPLGTKAMAASVLSGQKQNIIRLANLATTFDEEVQHSFEFLLETDEAKAKNLTKDIAVHRKQWDSDIEQLMARELGDIESRELIEVGILDVQAHLQIRTRVDERLITGPEFADTGVEVITDLLSLQLLVGQDSRAAPYKAWLGMFVCIQHLIKMAEYAGLLSVAFVTDPAQRSEHFLRLFSVQSSIAADVKTLEMGGDDEYRESLREMRASGFEKFEQLMKLLLTNNETLWGPEFAGNADKLHDLGHVMSKHQEAGFATKLDDKVNELQTDAIISGVEMLIGCLVAAVTLVFVVFINNHEQQKLRDALQGARKLKLAVQRFVPSNQLKSMGVRSILQVSRGMATELHQALLFSDIRAFTTLAATMTNMELFDWLQDYLSRSGDVITRNRGYVSNLIGDAIFAVFNQATDSMRAAIKLHVSTDTLNLEMVSDARENLISVGVGLHAGVVVAGVFGNESRLSCVHIAKHVNLASRLEGLTKTFGAKIIASQAIIDNINPEVFAAVRCLGEVLVAGEIAPVSIYDVFESDPLPLKKFKREHKEDFEAAVKIVLAEEEPQKALGIFRRIVAAGVDAKVEDKAAEHRLEFLTDDLLRGGRSGTLAFDKTGTRSGSFHSFGNSTEASPGHAFHHDELDIDSPQMQPQQKQKQQFPVYGFPACSSSSSSPSTSPVPVGDVAAAPHMLHSPSGAAVPGDSGSHTAPQSASNSATSTVKVPSRHS